jgi:hypothetical protein
MIANMKLYYRIIITDKNGKVTKRTRWRKSRSFLLQWMQMIEFITRHSWGGSGVTVTIKETGGTSRSFAASIIQTLSQCNLLAPDDNSGYGLVVGSGITAPTNIDYKLNTQIAHGVGAGQLDYGAQSYTSSAVVGANVDLVLTRPFYNGSGNSITIKEIGAYILLVDASTNGYSVCIIRDVVSDTPVPNAETATVQYTLRTTI